MKNSTQIPFAFQDTSESGDNPGVGVRIKSLKKSANEKGTNEKGASDASAEGQPEAKTPANKSAEPKLFDETNSDPVTEGQNPVNQTEAQTETFTEPQSQTLTNTPSETSTEAQINTETEGQINTQTEDQINLQTEAQNSISGFQPESSIENRSENPDLVNLALLSHHLENQTQEYNNSIDQIEDQTGYKNLDQNTDQTHDQTHDRSGYNDQSGDQTENAPESIIDHAGNGEEADLPVFRGPSLRADLSGPSLRADLIEAEGTQIEDAVASGSESESQEVEEQTDSGSISEKASKSTRGRKSLKTIDEGAELINIPPDEVLFRKQYYAIGEVAEMFHVNQSLLRFWETEFDIIQPRKNRKGDRHFRPVDIKNLLLIHDLLRRRKLTIEGAKDFLKKNKRSPERFAMIQSLQKIKGFILEIKATL